MIFSNCVFAMSTVESVLKLLALIVVFIIIMVACYLTTRFVGQQQLGHIRNSNFKVIDTFKPAPNKFLQIIKVGERYFLIAVSKDNISSIAELSADEIKLRDNERQGSFKDIFAKITSANSHSDEK